MSNKSNNELKKSMMMGKSPEENKNVVTKDIINSFFKRFKNRGSKKSDDSSK